jgi:glycosyltransferase involved in cell wall biosynthesis
MVMVLHRRPPCPSLTVSSPLRTHPLPIASSGDARSLIVAGALPPPANGMTVITATVLRSELVGRYEIVHVDLSDHRDISNVGRFDMRNIALALLHGARFSLALLRGARLAYVPIGRDRTGFLRDALMLLPARLAGCRVVVHLHSRDFVTSFYDREAPWMRTLIRAALGGDTHAIVLGESRRGDFDGLVPAERVHVLPNGVADVGAGPPAGERRPEVLFLSLLRREKGVFELLDAAREIVARRPDARFTFAGSWYRDAERREAESFIARHGLDDAITFVGPVSGDAKNDLLRRAAVLAFPSRYMSEGHPLVLLEALSAGTPCVATAIAAIPEIVADGEVGRLIPEADTAALAQALESLLADPILRTRMGDNARRRYLREFTAQMFETRLTKIIDAVSGRGSGSGVRSGRPR